MYEIPIEDVHRLLETAEAALRRIDAIKAQSIELVELPELFELVIDVDVPAGINSSLLNRIKQMRGRIQKRDAFKVADRIRTFLKSQDQAFTRKAKLPRPKPREAPKPSQVLQQTTTAQIIAGDRWIVLGASAGTKLKIGTISSLLDSIIQQVARSNAPPQEQILTEIERQQLIAILETALNVLRSPLVETGLLKKTRTILQNAAKSAGEKQLQQGLGALMNIASERIFELLRLLGISM